MLEEFEKNIGYTFKNKTLLAEALTHPSTAQKRADGTKFNYERLELLGDSVLSTIITEYLLIHHRMENEGELSKRRALLVSTETLYKIAKEKVHLDKYIIISKGEETSDGRTRTSNLENCMEAVIGAMFLDSSFERAKQFVIDLWKDVEVQVIDVPKPPKMELQEWTQEYLKILPEYKITEIKNGNNSIFKCELALEGFNTVHTEGTNKKSAEKQAALEMLQQIKNK